MLGVVLAVAVGAFDPATQAAIEGLAALHSYVAPDGRTFDQLVAAHVLPDPATTPGVLNPLVTDATLPQTLCSRVKDKDGFTWIHDQRPPDAYTDALKLKDLGPGMKPEDCEEDHLFSIEDGGHPRDPRNLWCMVYKDRYGARVKDVLETKVAKALCAGKMSLSEAQSALAPNWLIGYVKYIGPLPQ